MTVGERYLPKMSIAGDLPDVCGEKNELSIVLEQADQLELDGGPFEYQKSLAWVGGLHRPNRGTSKYTGLVFTNYDDIVLGEIGVVGPKNKQHIWIMLIFMTESVPTDMEHQQELYKTLPVPPTGEYKPELLPGKNLFGVHIGVGEYHLGISTPINDEATGTATLTYSSDEVVCGKIDFSTKKGTVIKGSFALEIEKDVWKR